MWITFVLTGKVRRKGLKEQYIHAVDPCKDGNVVKMCINTWLSTELSTYQHEKTVYVDNRV